MALHPLSVLRQGWRTEDRQPRDYGPGMRSYTLADLLVPPRNSLPIGLGEHGDFTNGPTNYEFRNSVTRRTYYWTGLRWELLRMDGVIR